MNNVDKIIKGQFFTREKLWQKKQVKDFITNSGCKIAYDPFAGEGNLLSCAELCGIYETKGLDIEPSLGWEINDSLVSIPHIEDAIIITNPPYLSNYSAARKKILNEVKCYFDTSCYDDLYLIALDKMLMAQDKIVAIIPETFINSHYLQKERLCSITILEENPFSDTDTPVCVACFDKNIKSYNEIAIYKNEKFISTLEQLESFRLKTENSVSIRFNTLDGWLGLRAVDTTNPEKMIHFDYKENFDYDWEKGIKTSSRLLSTIDVAIEKDDRQRFISECNHILAEVRRATDDIVLSPFKGNMKNGVRRRRLDYYTARAIMERAYDTIYRRQNSYEQLGLF